MGRLNRYGEPTDDEPVNDVSGAINPRLKRNPRRIRCRACKADFGQPCGRPTRGGGMREIRGYHDERTQQES